MKHLLLVLTLFILNIVNAQETITGTVTDTYGNSIPYVNIVLSGTLTGSTTNEDGIYTINVPNLSGTIEFSVLGYETQVIPINNRNTINVTLNDSSEI